MLHRILQRKVATDKFRKELIFRKKQKVDRFASFFSLRQLLTFTAKFKNYANSWSLFLLCFKWCLCRFFCYVLSGVLACFTAKTIIKQFNRKNHY